MSHAERPPRWNDTDELDESFAKCPKYDKHELTEDQIEDITERAAEKAVEKAKQQLYTGVGHAVVSRALWIIGFLAIGAYIWMLKAGIVKLPIDIPPPK